MHVRGGRAGRRAPRRPVHRARAADRRGRRCAPCAGPSGSARTPRASARLLEPARRSASAESMDRSRRRGVVPPEMQAMERHARAALAAADGRAGRAGARVPRVSGCSASSTWPCRGPGAGAVLFVVPNDRGGSSATGRSTPPTSARSWRSTRSTHRFEFARPWARERFARAARRLPVDAAASTSRACRRGSRRSTRPTPRRCSRCSRARRACSAPSSTTSSG